MNHGIARRPRQKKDRASCALGSDVTVKCAREIISSLSLFISISPFPLLVPCSRRSPQLRLINLSLFFNEVDAEWGVLCDKVGTKRELQENAQVSGTHGLLSQDILKALAESLPL